MAMAMATVTPAAPFGRPVSRSASAVRVERPRDRRGVARRAVPPQDRRATCARGALYDAAWLARPRRDRALAPARQAARPCLLPRRSTSSRPPRTSNFPGAIVAGLASPWGQAVPAGNRQDGKAPYFGSYREVFSRDLYEAFTALLVSGDLATARDTARFLLERQQLADGRLPRNSLAQRQARPTPAATSSTRPPSRSSWPSSRACATTATLYTDHIRKAADFLVARGPSFGNERWEEQGGYSPSTIAAEIAGLVAAGRIAAVQRRRRPLATSTSRRRTTSSVPSRAGRSRPRARMRRGRYFLRLSAHRRPERGHRLQPRQRQRRRRSARRG